ncbi:MAG: RDD family protein [Microcoleus sp. CSU_2_2]|nr:RDD family protein [Microcoleus sp. SU_5_3]NJS10356.1 RDD family protein [Microcoleus sp. CSU_2_2]
MRFFNRFTLHTPESVELEFTLAGIGNRAYALLIDYIILGVILLVFLIGVAIFNVVLLDTITKLVGTTNRIELWLIAIQGLIAFFIYVGYFVFFETVWSGQTPGKRHVKIRVIRDDGRPVRLQQSTLRALLRPFDDLFFIGVFFIVFSQREKRLGDLVGGTLVIQEEQPVKATLKVSNSAKSLINQLLAEADISRLLPEDFAVIREYLQRREAMIPNARNDLSKQLATQVKQIIGLEKLPTKVDANVFLEAVYEAYQQQFDK